ncbi:formimidoylglutamase [Pedobacter fastidiosus]|uniref:Formimidoylglutamase n=1 Tax=Pedobacter fastidiosus TaxID=2765361 RepID=A0ABR7KQ69_9SPHI|nr:formimidoylglutamase [Pedobacter fastidiosus]MBC6110109.1 formimidoylglutamase [Pedobacter fastidiosus]
MDKLKIYSQSEINNLIIYRDGETKLGEKVEIYRHSEGDSSSTVAISFESLMKSKAKFVLLGIPEDIGIRANAGIAGASTIWRPALMAFLNIQSNRFLHGEEILVLGHFEIEEPEDSSIGGLRNKVVDIDDLVFPVIEKIVSAGKIPIVIGGGHNNAFPIIKGTSLAKKQAIDVLNIDAHADLRKQEGRHSGNGFTYALAENYLNNYFMYGLHQNYNNEEILNQNETNPKLKAVFFDEILKCANDKDFFFGIGSTAGLEIDLDCIQNVLSSAETPSGFAVNDIRKLILTSKREFSYLHISEGATRLLDGRVSKLTSKLIAYLVSDFIKAQV